MGGMCTYFVRGGRKCVCIFIYFVHNRAIRSCHSSHSMPLVLIFPYGGIRPFLTRNFFQEILELEGSKKCLEIFCQVHNLKISDVS